MNSRSAPYLLGALALVGTSLVAGGSHAQTGDSRATPTSQFMDVMEVEIVDVDVYVTDKSGRPVRDLTAADFEVFEDGRPVEVTNFRLVDLGRERPPPPTLPVEPAPPEAAAETAPEVPSEVAPEEPPLSLILYVDNAFIRSTSRLRVLRDLRELVRSVETPARFMVLSHERSIQVHQPFTTDRQRVIQTLLELEEVPVFGGGKQGAFMDLLREIQSPDMPQYVLENRVRAYAQEELQNVRLGIESMRELMDSLAGLPGRKALVYASDALPLTPAEELFQALQVRFFDMSSLQGLMEFTAARDFQVLTQIANTAGVTFYTVHAAGLEAPLGSSAEVSGSGFDELRATVDSVRTANLQAPGRILAGETGGLAMLNTNDFSADLGRMLQDFATHYSLGYRPRHQSEGRYHEIKVKVKRDGVEVRHRRGYRDRSLPQRMEDAVVAALEYGNERNPLAIEVSAGPPEIDPEAPDTAVVAFKVSIPLDRVVLIPRASTYEGSIHLYLAVRDDRGGTSPVHDVPVAIRIPNADLKRALSQSWHQEVKLRVRPGAGQIVVGYWDDIGRTSSIVRQRFRAAGP